MEGGFIAPIRVPPIECTCGFPLGLYHGARDQYEADLAAGEQISTEEFIRNIDVYKLRADFARDVPDKLDDIDAFERYAAENYHPYRSYLKRFKGTQPLQFAEFFQQYIEGKSNFSSDLGDCCIRLLLNPQYIPPNTYVHEVRRKELEAEIARGGLTRTITTVSDIAGLAAAQQKSVLDYSNYYNVGSNEVFRVNVRPPDKSQPGLLTYYQRINL